MSASGPSAGAEAVLESWRYDPPAGEYRVAWEYLLPQSRMIRRVDTVQVHSVRQATRSMELDVEVPSPPPGAERSSGRCYVPISYLEERPVASDLEVHDGNGALLAVPTRPQSMALTVRALAELSSHAPALTGEPTARYQLDDGIQELVAALVCDWVLPARLFRLQLAKELPREVEDWLMPLLRRLEDHYLLWAPLDDSSTGPQRLSVRRSEPRSGDPLFRPRGRRRSELIYAVSPNRVVAGRWNPPSRIPVPDPLEAVGRLLVALGMMPVKFRHESAEARRFDSYHVRILPPPDLLLREVKAGRIDEAAADLPGAPIEDLPKEINQTVQGEDTRVGHVHCGSHEKPHWLHTRVTIGLLPGTTTMWALVVILTSGLLWAFHRNTGALLNGDDNRLAIAVAILLIGPTFASAWAIRDKDRALLRSMLVGARLLMMAAAILAVATALALIGFRPFGWSAPRAIEWYASASYAVATLIVIGWVQARSLVWFAYREALTKPRRNLAATLVLALSAATVIACSDASHRGAGLLLLAIGLCLSAVAGNRTAVSLGEVNRLSAILAALGAIVAIAIAGHQLGFYDSVLGQAQARRIAAEAEFSVAIAAMLVFLRRTLRQPGSLPPSAAQAGAGPQR
jgi:hypothetical protein